MELDIKLSSNTNKAEAYQELFPQLEAYFSGEDDFVANMANLSAILQDAFDFLWTGFYLWKEAELVLGPFQGPMACTRIQIGRGVCGTAFEKRETIIVPDVDAFSGHIACSVLSRSEIVVPMIEAGKAFGVLDIDSSELDSFDETDASYLEKIVALLLNHSKI